MCVFRPVLQRFGSDIAHVLHVKAGGCGSSANQCTAHVWKWRHVLVNMKSPIQRSIQSIGPPIHSHFHHCLDSQVHVLIYTAESTGASWREWRCPNFETVTKRGPNPGSLDCESGILTLSYHAEKTWQDCLKSGGPRTGKSSVFLHNQRTHLPAIWSDVFLMWATCKTRTRI